MITWRKSSRSGSTTIQSDCVEVARLDGNVALRDSKNPGGGHLILPADGFAALLHRLKHDEPTP
ncbi:DUF397 domain-containing protein [Actinomadura craniellae]|uniref:DUF397 domain-containing protein n=1 Tax=Actinomadura craniellae TaxID=2231787 RepID=A0A365H116_9ACTN|nr:DUF397 domain-containing protein [Actinomadura craniellae]RAY12785.1 DUF397 domain-containing protein [Actinomadura craniellae]